MERPSITDAPGIGWRRRKSGWLAIWQARQDLVKKGYRPSVVRLALFAAQPTQAEEIAIRARCIELQTRMYGDKQPDPNKGKVRGLIHAYQADGQSAYKAMAYKSRIHTDHFLRRIDEKLGDKNLADIGARDFLKLYADLRWPNGKESRELVFSAHAAITALRMVISYGVTFEFEVEKCRRLKEILSGLKFENGKARSEALTLRQCEGIITAAHRLGFPSIALTQALQFDLRVRQKDVIGEWLPIKEPGISTIEAWRGRKWLHGIRWEEVSSGLLLQHPATKTGKLIERKLSLYPMIMAELDRVPADKRSGPLVVCELTGRPWKSNHYRMKWRLCADAAGVPKTVYSMDSRAGGISETVEATGSLEMARKEAQHSKLEQTAKYSRRDREAIERTAAAVLEFRKNSA